MKRYLSVILCLCILFSGGLIVFAESDKEIEIDNNISATIPYDFSGDVKNEIINGKNAFSVINDGGYLTYKINCENDGEYWFKVKYYPLESNSNDILFSFTVNNEALLEDSDTISLPRYYRDNGIAKDFKGNDIKTVKTEVFDWFEQIIYDKNRINSEPLSVKLKKGENIIRLDFINAVVAIGEIVFYTKTQNTNYKEYSKIIKNNRNTDEELIYIQGENATLTTDKMLAPTYDRQSSETLSSDNSKNDAAFLRLNTIGQSSWNKPGQSIVWKFNIEKDGIYNIGMRIKQSEARGVFSTRRVLIDGKLLFDELNQIEFDYNDSWQMLELGEDEPYSFYLTAGEHTITMEAVSGRLGKYTEQLEKMIAELNTLYRKIIMVTGTTPDTYRDYRLQEAVPELVNTISDIIARLEEIEKNMLSENIQSSSDMVVLQQLIVQLRDFSKKPRTIPVRLTNFQDNISSLSSWAISLTQQPLELDYIYIKGNNTASPDKTTNIFKTLLFRFKMFVASFVTDYTTMSENIGEGVEKLEVWVNLSRDQTQIISDLIQNDFTPKTGINVELYLVQQSIVTAIAASCEPDVQLYAADVVNLAARNAVTPISNIDGFEETKEWFSKNAFVPYTYENNIYGLPLNQSFLMMFCRTDIFDELGIEVPKTWDELINTIIVLQKNKLTAGIPTSTGIFSAMLFQQGGTYYNEDYSKTAFDSEIANSSFRRWTEFYTKYRLPQSYSALVRFRSGEMPLLIDNYTAYNTFAVAAPEIDGLWKMYPIPGTLSEDGTLDNTTISGGNSAVILNSCKNKVSAFKFIKWFASAEIQIQYGINVENVLGTGSRYDPANVNALSAMNWSSENVKILTEQLIKSNFEPQIPASYFVGRTLDNAYRAVTIKGENPREALYSYNLDINAEITRKRNELGIKEEVK